MRGCSRVRAPYLRVGMPGLERAMWHSCPPRELLEVRTWDRGRLTALIYQQVLQEGTPASWWTRASWGTLDLPASSIPSLEEARISYFVFLLPLPSSIRLLLGLILNLPLFLVQRSSYKWFSFLCFFPKISWLLPTLRNLKSGLFSSVRRSSECCGV